jgi:hypothetical protein
MTRALPRRTLIRATRHYTLFTLDDELRTEPAPASEHQPQPFHDEPSDEAIWTLLEHVPLRGPQLELVLGMLSRMPAI